MPKQRQNLPENVASVPVNDGVKGLIRNKDILSSRLDRFEAFVRSFQQTLSSANLNELDSRLKHGESNLLKEYNDVQCQLTSKVFRKILKTLLKSIIIKLFR